MAPIPYNICDESLLEKEARSARLLEGIYHKGQTKIWDGNEVLDELMAKHGNEANLYDHYGKVIILDLSVMWCGPCQMAGKDTGSVRP